MIKKIILLLIILLTIFRASFLIINNDYKCDKKSIEGVITNIKKDENKTVLDVKENDLYRITVYKNLSYNLGDTIQVFGIFEVAPSNTVFNLFNYKNYLLSKNIKFISKNPKTKLIKKNKSIMYFMKNKMFNHINKLSTKSYLFSFVLGDNSYMDEGLKTNIRNLGISHLFSISGMHVALILFVINLLFKKNKYKELINIIFLFLFLFLTNYTESLERCFLFILLSFFNRKLKLNLSSVYILIISACILIFINPFIIYSIGFIFSFTITYFMLISKNILTGNYFIKLVKSSFICYLASIPVLATNFFKINLLTPFYNVIFIPIVSFIIFPLGLLTFFISPLNIVYEKVVYLFEKLVLVFGNINVFNIILGKPSVLLITLYYLFLYLSLKKNNKYLLVFIIVFIININIKYFIKKPFITYLDVGQGDSSIIVFPRGKAIIIDTGGLYNSTYSIAENKIIPYLNSYGISKIDAVILTHGDFDHMGEAINLVNNFKVEKVIFNCGEFNNLESKLIKVLDKKKIKYYCCIKKIDNLYFLQTKEYNNENENSNVIYTELNGYKFMFMGDAGVEKEKDILDKYNISDIDVLKVGHHGSKTSSGKDFIGEINPKYSVISVGKNNRYGHPNKEVLNNLEDSKIYRTDKQGSIMFKIKNNKLNIENCSP